MEIFKSFLPIFKKEDNNLKKDPYKEKNLLKRPFHEKEVT